MLTDLPKRGEELLSGGHGNCMLCDMNPAMGTQPQREAMKDRKEKQKRREMLRLLIRRLGEFEGQDEVRRSALPVPNGAAPKVRTQTVQNELD